MNQATPTASALAQRRPQGHFKLNDAGDDWTFDHAANDAHAKQALAQIAQQDQADYTALKAQLIEDCNPILRQYRNALEFGLPCNIDADTAKQVASYQNALYDWHCGEPQPALPKVMAKTVIQKT